MERKKNARLHRTRYPWLAMNAPCAVCSYQFNSMWEVIWQFFCCCILYFMFPFLCRLPTNLIPLDLDLHLFSNPHLATERKKEWGEKVARNKTKCAHFQHTESKNPCWISENVGKKKDWKIYISKEWLLGWYQIPNIPNEWGRTRIVKFNLVTISWFHFDNS